MYLYLKLKSLEAFSVESTRVAEMYSILALQASAGQPLCLELIL